MANLPLHATITAAVRALVSEATGIAGSAVIPADDNHPAPNGLYSTVLGSTIRMEGLDSETVSDNSGDDTQSDIGIKGNRIGFFSVQFYRTGANDAVMDLIQYPSSSVGQIYMAGQGLTLRRMGEARDIKAIMGSKYEERQQIDIEIGWINTKADTVNSLASANIDINMSADGVDYEDNLEVTE